MSVANGGVVPVSAAVSAAGPALDRFAPSSPASPAGGAIAAAPPGRTPPSARASPAAETAPPGTAAAGPAGAASPAGSAPPAPAPAALPPSQPPPDAPAPTPVPAPKVNQTAFVQKLYNMLEDAAIQHLISWTPSNDSFVVSPGEEFSKVLSQYFKHTNVSSFVRQLNMYGFHKVNDVFHAGGSAESGQWEFKHGDGSFKRGDVEALRGIKRRASRQSIVHRDSISGKAGTLSMPVTPLSENGHQLMAGLAPMGTPGMLPDGMPLGIGIPMPMAGHAIGPPSAVADPDAVRVASLEHTVYQLEQSHMRLLARTEYVADHLRDCQDAIQDLVALVAKAQFPGDRAPIDAQLRKLTALAYRGRRDDHAVDPRDHIDPGGLSPQQRYDHPAYKPAYMGPGGPGGPGPAPAAMANGAPYAPAAGPLNPTFLRTRQGSYPNIHSPTNPQKLRRNTLDMRQHSWSGSSTTSCSTASPVDATAGPDGPGPSHPGDRRYSAYAQHAYGRRMSTGGSLAPPPPPPAQHHGQHAAHLAHHAPAHAHAPYAPPYAGPPAPLEYAHGHHAPAPPAQPLAGQGAHEPHYQDPHYYAMRRDSATSIKAQSPGPAPPGALSRRPSLQHASALGGPPAAADYGAVNPGFRIRTLSPSQASHKAALDAGPPPAASSLPPSHPSSAGPASAASSGHSSPASFGVRFRSATAGGAPSPVPAPAPAAGPAGAGSVGLHSLLNPMDNAAAAERSWSPSLGPSGRARAYVESPPLSPLSESRKRRKE
ncbi:HSF-type DNA-binding-domain-containing protein [Dipodascopsis tothii]|uniref:HSF-type DNA-binding-domain-containing protein n=1 Tax=Dipodascopsis tothii TaxID=44089 RepID=UPI0034CD6FE1